MVSDDIVNYVGAGKRVKIYRIERDLSQEELASHANMSVQYLSHVENARSKASLSTFIKIANSLDVTLNDLLYDSIKQSRVEFEKEIAAVLKDCSDYEMRVLANCLNGIKMAIRNSDGFRDTTHD